MVYQHATYQSFLKSVLLDRTEKNPSYSLRAMAKQLNLAPSLLSEIFNGNRQLTEDNAQLIAEKIGLPPDQALYLRTLVQLGRAKKPELRQAILKQLQVMNPITEVGHDLTVDTFMSIADWQHFALLKLMDIADFPFSISTASKALGIHPLKTEEALGRLQRLELIKLDANGNYQKLKTDITVKSAQMNEALQKYHRQMLEKTIEALNNQTPAQRYTGTENITLSANQRKEVEAAIEECFNKILKISKKAEKDSEVYHLGIHMIRLSESTKTQKSAKPPRRP